MKEFHGEGEITVIGDILNELNATNVLLVHGEKSYELSGAAEYFALLSSRYNIISFRDFKNNARFEDVTRGIELMNQTRPDVVISLGGGTAIDIAKSLVVLAEHSQQCEQILRGELPVPQKVCPLIIVPTTAGSGSEATRFAIVYIDGKKHAIEDDAVLPDYVILDPMLTYTLPRYQTAVSGFDAFCHAIEAYWSVNSTAESKYYAARAIKLIVKNLEAVVNSPDATNRKNMLLAANFAGKAINISKSTAPHAIAYCLTMNYDIPHGHAVALTLAPFLEINSRHDSVEWNDQRGESYVDATMKELITLMGCHSISEAAALFKDMLRHCGLESCLAALGIEQATQLNDIKRRVDPGRLRNNPIRVDEEMLDFVLGQR